MIGLKKKVEMICCKAKEIINNKKVISVLLWVTVIGAVASVGISVYYNSNSFFGCCAAVIVSSVELIGPIFNKIKEKKGSILRSGLKRWGLIVIIINFTIIVVLSPLFQFPKVYTVNMQPIAGSAVDYKI